jgi:hypothetical protein
MLGIWEALMKKLLLPALILLLFTAASANSERPAERKHALSAALETSSYIYKEPKLDTPVRWEGVLTGVSLRYTGRALFSNEPLGSDSSFFSAELRYLTGYVDYNGWTQGGARVDTHDIQDYFIEGQIKSGKVYNITPALDVRLYAGLGIRYLVDKFDKAAGGYCRTQNYVYAPMGLQAGLYLPNNWALHFNGEFDWFISGRQRSRFSDVAQGANKLTFKQKEGYGARFSVKAEKWYEKYAVFAEPFFRYWRIQESDIDHAFINGAYAGSYLEPNNETIEWGLRAGFTF